MLLFIFLLIFSTHAQEVVKPHFERKIELKIVRAEPDSFETSTLLNHNGREMTLICAKNRVYDHNPKAMIRYRNFFGEEVGDFTMEDNKVCTDMSRFIESSRSGIGPDHPFLITLNPNTQKIERITYPNIDPYLDKGDLTDLFHKDGIYMDLGFPVPASLFQGLP